MGRESPMSEPDFFDDTDESQHRRRRRLREALVLDEDSVEIILRLHGQMVAMQKLLLELQAELALHHAARGLRLIEYRRASDDATWYETPSPDQS